jgi:hypothetical protein
MHERHRPRWKTSAKDQESSMNIFPRKASRRATGTLHIATALLAVIITRATGAQAAQTTSWIGTWAATPAP